MRSHQSTDPKAREDGLEGGTRPRRRCDLLPLASLCFRQRGVRAAIPLPSSSFLILPHSLPSATQGKHGAAKQARKHSKLLCPTTTLARDSAPLCPRGRQLSRVSVKYQQSTMHPSTTPRRHPTASSYGPSCEYCARLSCTKGRHGVGVCLRPSLDVGEATANVNVCAPHKSLTVSLPILPTTGVALQLLATLCHQEIYGASRSTLLRANAHNRSRFHAL